MQRYKVNEREKLLRKMIFPRLPLIPAFFDGGRNRCETDESFCRVVFKDHYDVGVLTYIHEYGHAAAWEELQWKEFESAPDYRHEAGALFAEAAVVARFPIYQGLFEHRILTKKWLTGTLKVYQTAHTHVDMAVPFDTQKIIGRIVRGAYGG